LSTVTASPLSPATPTPRTFPPPLAPSKNPLLLGICRQQFRHPVQRHRLGGSAYGITVPSGINTVTALTQDSYGNILVAGYTDAIDLPTTPGVLQPALAGSHSFDRRTTDAFLAKLNPTGTALLFSTYIGDSGNDRISDLQLHTQNNIWITGANTSPGSFFAQISADGSRLLVNQPTPAATTGQAIRLSNQLAILGPSGAVLRTPPG
jgi:hypothetical protein